MTREEIKAYYEALESHPVEKAQLEALVAKAETNTEKIAAVNAMAKQLGLEITETDVGDELSDDELDAVVGGGKCYCPWAGGGSGGNTDGRRDFTCACVLGGGGETCMDMSDYKNRCCRCACVIAGVGPV